MNMYDFSRPEKDGLLVIMYIIVLIYNYVLYVAIKHVLHEYGEPIEYPLA